MINENGVINIDNFLSAKTFEICLSITGSTNLIITAKQKINARIEKVSFL